MMAEELFVHISKITDGQRNFISVPKKIADKLDLEKTYVKFTMYDDNTFKMMQCDVDGRETISEPNQLQEEIMQRLLDLKNHQLEMNHLIEKKFNELYKISKIINNNINSQSDTSTQDIKEEKSELINIKLKDESDYRYIFRYYEQDQEEYDQIREMMGDEPKLDYEEYNEFKGIKFIKGIGGYPSILMDEPCDWECLYKGNNVVLQADYFLPHLYTYIKDENGNEQRVSYDEIKPFEKEALYEFIATSGEKYLLDYEEMWFDPYKYNAIFLTVEEFLSKELHQEFLDGKIDKYMDETDEYARIIV